MRLIKKIFIITIVLLLILSCLSYIDYFLVKTKNVVPKISLKEEKKEFIVYKAPFYKVWYCKDSKTIVIGGYDDPDAVCPKNYTYDNGYYTNSLGIKISQRDLELITKNGIYTSEMVEAMKDNKSVNDAVYVASLYGKTIYKKLVDKKDNEILIDDNYLVAFPEFKKVKGIYDWYYDEEDETQIYCLIEKDNEIIYSKYENNSCDKNYNKLKLDAEWCGKYKDSTLVYNEDVIKKLCEE